MTEKAELVGRVYEALNRADPDALVALAHEDVEFVSILSSVEGGAYRGHDGLRRYVDDLQRAWDEATWTVERVVELDQETVVAVSSARFHARSSGMQLDQAFAVVLRFRDGLVWRAEAYADVDEAFKAANARPGA